MDDSISIASTDSHMGPKCRICADHQGTMVSPCDCKGSIAYVHGACLDQWIAVRKHSQCPVCQSDYARIYRMNRCRLWKRPEPVYGYRIGVGFMYSTFLWMFCFGPVVFLTLCVIGLFFNERVNPGDLLKLAKFISTFRPDQFWIGIIFMGYLVLIWSFILVTIIYCVNCCAVCRKWRLDNGNWVWTNKKRSVKKNSGDVENV